MHRKRHSMGEPIKNISNSYYQENIFGLRYCSEYLNDFAIKYHISRRSESLVDIYCSGYPVMQSQLQSPVLDKNVSLQRS